jgi:hypothetical protein
MSVLAACRIAVVGLLLLRAGSRSRRAGEGLHGVVVVEQMEEEAVFQRGASSL